MNLDRLFQTGIGISLIGVVWCLWPQPAGAYYSPYRWGPATYHHGPVVLIDRGHWNESAADPGFDALARVLAGDGYSISTSRQEFVPELLQTARVLVVSDALGFTGWLGRFGVRTRGNAFHADEVDAVRDWVRAGGSVLLVADRPPAVDAVRPLASALGMSIADRAHRELGRGRVAVITTQLADPHNRAIDSRNTMLEIVHWLSRAE
jgi:hypothetical protein